VPLIDTRAEPAEMIADGGPDVPDLVLGDEGPCLDGVAVSGSIQGECPRYLDGFVSCQL
jgi:hypothetical protein